MSVAEQLVQGLGGASNIDDLESCILRIRAIVNDPSAVNEPLIRETKPLALVCSGKYVQIIFGQESDALVEQMQDVIGAQPQVSQ